MSEPGTELTISAWAGGKEAGEARVWTLACDPSGGTHPNPEDACRRLATLDEPFVPTPPDTVCAAIYGGPAVAEVSGVHDGVTVEARFTRTDSCEIARWNRHAFLFPVTPGAP